VQPRSVQHGLAGDVFQHAGMVSFRSFRAYTAVPAHAVPGVLQRAKAIGLHLETYSDNWTEILISFISVYEPAGYIYLFYARHVVSWCILTPCVFPTTWTNSRHGHSHGHVKHCT
jgi:hypothetical protein